MLDFGDVLTIIGIVWCIYMLFIFYAKRRKRAIAHSKRRICPFCAESIRESAKVCRYCEKELPEFEIDATHTCSRS